MRGIGQPRRPAARLRYGGRPEFRFVMSTLATLNLHFAIAELDAARQWWSGRPIDPYLVFK